MELTTQQQRVEHKPQHTAPGLSLPPLLGRAETIVRNLGADFAADAGKLLTLQQRLAEERFHLTVLGHFKRGKSTLINALLGAKLLPVSVVPLTSVPTFLRAGERLSAHVMKLDGKAGEEFWGESAEECCRFLARFVTEEANPKNRLGVSFVEVRHPAALLRQGVVLIDTPGIGSTYRHNTEATLNFLPQCDAALFVVSADPPLTEVEVEFLKTVRTKVARLFFILNKVDYLSTDEQQTAVLFLRKVLREQAGIDSDVRIFCTSARDALAAKESHDAVRWQRSGLAEVEQHLTEFLMTEKADTLGQAVARKARDVIGDVLLRLNLTVRSLQMPLAQLDERMRQFEQHLTQAEQQRRNAADMLEGDKKRMREFLEEQAEHLRQKARRHLERVVNQSLAETNGGTINEKAVQEQLAEAIPGFFEHELGETTQTFRQRLSEVAAPHQQRANALIESVRQAAAELFDVPYRASDGAEGFVTAHEPYWVAHRWDGSLLPIPAGFADWLLPEGMRRARVKRRLIEQVQTLVIQNVENLRWSTLQNMNLTFLHFASRLDEGLEQTIATTCAAIQAARRKREENTGEVESRVAELRYVATQVEPIQKCLDEEAALRPRADAPQR
jgi:small GTP-binding protein